MVYVGMCEDQEVLEFANESWTILYHPEDSLCLMPPRGEGCWQTWTGNGVHLVNVKLPNGWLDAHTYGSSCHGLLKPFSGERENS